MIAEFARGERTQADDGGPAVLDVSGVETERVEEYAVEWFADVPDVHLEHKGGKTFLVAGE